jgi:hypothetical protein
VEQTDLAWAAGFIDGEGCIRVDKYYSRTSVNPSHALSLSVSNTNREILKWFKNFFGMGHISKNGKNPLSKRNSYQWRVYSDDAAKVLTGVLPYLREKKEQADYALDFIVLFNMTKSPGKLLSDEVLAQRDAYYWVLKEAKHG